MGQIHKTETSLDELFSKFAIDPEDEIVFSKPEKEFPLDKDEKTAASVKEDKKRNVKWWASFNVSFFMVL